MQPLKIPIGSGLNLAALSHRPVRGGLSPLVILLHGFTGYKEEEHIVTLADALAAAGIAAVHLDAPGSGESDGTWADDYRLTNYLEAIPDVITFLRSTLPVDPHRIGLWGHSMGGFVALAAAARHPEDVAALVCSQPSSGWRLHTPGRTDPWRTTGWSTFSNSHFPEIKLPYAFLEDRQQYDALREAPNLKAPVLFIAGTNDVLVPAERVRKMFQVAPEPKVYLDFPTAHDYKRDPENLARINEATVDFFVKNL